MSQKPLPVGKVLLGAFYIPWTLRRSLLRQTGWPLLMLAFMESYLRLALPEPGWWIMTAYILGYLLLGVLVAVRCHRLVLLGEQAAMLAGTLDWSGRNSRFLGWAVLVYIVVTAFFAVSVTLVGTLFVNMDAEAGEFWLQVSVWLATVAATYLLARWSPLFPATALDRKAGLVWAWDLTRSNGLRMLALVGLLPWCYSMLVWLLLPEDAGAFLNLLSTLLVYPLLLVEISALSLAYRELVVNEGELRSSYPRIDRLL